MSGGLAVKNLMLPPLWPRFNPWPRNFHVLWTQPRKKKKKKKKKSVKLISSLRKQVVGWISVGVYLRPKVIISNNLLERFAKFL